MGRMLKEGGRILVSSDRDITAITLGKTGGYTAAAGLQILVRLSTALDMV